MNKQQEFLVRAGRDLGIQVIVPFEVRLPSGANLTAEALLPQLGASNGMLVFQSDKVCDFSEELEKLGFGYSVYDEPSPQEIFDAENYKEMFVDWGWTSETDVMPEWMK